MLANYFKIAIRILWRNKAYSLINILGLAIGLCSSIIVYLYVQHEFSYDRFHPDSERIYRFIMQEQRNGTTIAHPYCRLPLGPALKNDFPEIEEVIRAKETSKDFVYENHVFTSDKLFYVDPGFFSMFNFPMLEGNPEHILKGTNAIILSASFAKKIFKDVDPIGKIITSLYGDQFIVRGIANDPPSNTMFHFDGIMPVAKFVGSGRNFSWVGGPEFDTYVKLKEKVDLDNLTLKFLPFFKKHVSDRNQNGYLQPLKDIYFHSSNLAYSDKDIHYQEVVLFALISIFILFIAIINYVNLSTARSVKRAKEVGIKKVVGATRITLIKQFFAESYLIVLVSIILTLILVEIFLPVINNLVGYELSLYNLGYQNILIIVLLFFVIVGSLSAFYPALFLSSFHPDKVLKGGLSVKRKSYLRNGLVILQFFIASILISSTFYATQQLKFIRNKPLGYSRDNLMLVRLNPGISDKHELIKNELLNIPGIEMVAASSGSLGNSGFNGDNCKPEGMTEAINVRFLEADPDFIKTMQINVIKGRDFSKNLVTDKNNCIINKTFADLLGWNDPINKKFKTYLGDLKIIGVVDDFHFRSLQSKIEPLVLTCNEFLGFYWLNIKLNDERNIQIIIEEIEKVVKGIDESQPLIYSFMDERYETIYNAEAKFGKIFQLFSFLAIFIASMGLFGLAAYTAEQRTRELGIRKVFGASAIQLLVLLSNQYFKIVVLANVVAIPVVIYLLQSWQSNYAYFVPISISLFVLTFITNALIAAIIIYSQSARAASLNPVETLKYE